MSNSRVSDLWWKWLVVMCAATVFFSLALIFLPVLSKESFSALYLGSADAYLAFSETGVRYVLFIQGVLGAVMVGWMLSMIAIIMGPFRRGEFWSWKAIAGSLVLWFLLDSGYSIASGFWQNAILNLTLLVGFAVPLAASFRQFRVS